MSADIHVIDVGNGNCAIARGNNWTVMVDAGPGDTAIKALEDLAISGLDVIVISHRDNDHSGGLVPILSDPALTIGELFVPADAAKDPSAPETALLLAALEDAKASERCAVSRDLDSALPSGMLDGGGIAVEVLAPSFSAGMTGPKGKNTGGATMTSNTMSAVVRITLPDNLRVLLPGDVDDIGLRELQQCDSDLSADVLVFPHHGSHSSVPDEEDFAQRVMAAVAPKTVLFSVGRTSRVRPTEAVMRGVLNANPDAYVACTQLSSGCLALDSDLPDPPAIPEHLTSVAAAGLLRCRSCAGSMLLTDKGLAGPSPDAHQDFIDEVASTPMCRTLRC